ncbi:MAG: outer membrane protein assembly factor BamA [Deltaproteobacteria bacterium]|jgi:outer membrane protein insertion porin family|nr:outer membrane protein assembly factor BamA [Deltaproteobacteria bacterium]
MSRKIAALTVMFILSLAFSEAVLSQEGLKVAVMPYTIVGASSAKLEQLNNMAMGLMEITARSFSAQGFVPLTLGSQALSSTQAAVMADARQLGADYLFVPTLTSSGESFTLSGQLLALNSSGTSSRRVDLVAPSSQDLSPYADNIVILATDHLYGTGPAVVSVEIVGSGRANLESLLNNLRVRKGGTYSEAKVASDIHRLFSLGYFDDIQVETEDVSGGKAVRFVVTERGQIGQIVYEGNEEYDDDDLNEVVGIKPMDVGSDDRILLAVSNLQRFYASKGYSNVIITHELQQGKEGRSKLIFHINEGGKTYINDIIFEGNETYGNWKLSRVVESKSKGLLSFITGSGKLERDKLLNDSQLLTAFYQNNGFLQARVGEPSIELEEDGRGYNIIFPIVEGPRFKVGEVLIGGDLQEDDDPEKMMKILRVTDETWMSREIVMADQTALVTYYKDKGYYHADVGVDFVPAGGEDPDVLNLTFNVEPRNLVYFNRITIVGNQKTRDKVIRRQLEVAEGDLTSESKLLVSQNNLMRSSFFDEVTIEPSPSNVDQINLVDLRVTVKERPTGSFQIGAGYSNYSSIYGTVSVTQDNLFGYGRRISLQANVGGEYRLYNLSFTDPWVGDIPLLLGFDVFKTYYEYDYYDKNTTGVAVRAGYPIFERFYISGSYTWEKVDISDVSAYSSHYLRDMLNLRKNSIFSLRLGRDTRNHFFQPTQGSTARFSYSIATAFLGGETSFSRYELEGAKWFPVPFWRGAAIMGHAEIGYLTENKEGGLPTYEKFFLGGINTVRGYDWYEISPKDPETGETIGGEKQFFANLEFTFPIIENSGLVGVIFYDMGNVWTKDEKYKFGDLRKSYGGGLRYLSPMGPLRIEYGKALDATPGEPSGRWEFTMGAMF